MNNSGIKHRIKMIVTDLDGTLLKTDKTISEKTKAIFNKCRKLGIKIVYATGRGVNAEKRAPAKMFDGRIIMNGALAWMDDIEIYAKIIPHQMARPLLMACDRHYLMVSSEINGMHYSNFLVSDIWPFIKNFQIVNFSQHRIDAQRLHIRIEQPNDMMLIKKYLSDDLYLIVNGDGFGQVMHKDARKSKAMAVLAKKWDINPCEIVAFGDNLNDIDMLEYAGIGVAMENAIREVKNIADYICHNNDENGIARWIEKYI